MSPVRLCPCCLTRMRPNEQFLRMDGDDGNPIDIHLECIDSLTLIEDPDGS